MFLRIIIAMLVVGASSVMAADVKKNEQFYIGAAFSYVGGTDFDYNSPAPTGALVGFAGATEEAEVDGGIGGAVRIGYDFKGFLRAEAEYSYHSTELETANGISTFNKKNINLHSIGLTLIGEYNNSSRFTPYVHAGAGAVIADINAQATGPAQETFSEAVVAPAVSFGVGSAFAITSMLELDLRYRAAVIPTAEDLKSTILVHGVTAGVNIKF
jgi:OmpA-OmpF porin, OOP family